MPAEMNVIECIRTRRSVRKYLDKPVESDKLATVLESGNSAPSSGNLQNWRFIIVTDEKIKNELAEASLKQYWMLTAPVFIVVVAIPGNVVRYYGHRGEHLYSVQNSAAAVQNMLISANYLGLGSCWIGAFDEEGVKRSLNIPDSARPQAIITLGYPDGPAYDTHSFKLFDMVFFNKWEARIKDIEWALGEYGPSVLKSISKGTKEFYKKHKNTLVKFNDKGQELIDKIANNF